MVRFGKDNPNWKGGITKPKCEICNKIITYKAKRCNKHRDRTAHNNPKWRGGRVRTYEGYIQIYKPTHPKRNNYGYVLEHRLLIESKIGRYLEENEIVHHKNHKVDDNRLDNLELMTKSDHAKLHYKLRGGLKNDVKSSRTTQNRTIKS